jgi:hypothetical protein
MEMVWKAEELPQDWEEGIICPVIKKGDQLQCSNYWRIGLLHSAYKIGIF